MIDEENIFFDTLPFPTIDLDKFPIHHHDIGAGRSRSVVGRVGEESQGTAESCYGKGKLFHFSEFRIPGSRAPKTTG
jgi:hypothetical protein